MPNSWTRRFLLGHDRERRGQVFRPVRALGGNARDSERPVHKVCGMRQISQLPACHPLGASLLFVATLVLALSPAARPARAEVIKNEIAIFAALDKVTGRISHLEIPINQTVAFGALKVTPRACNTRPPTEAPDTASFVEVDEVKLTGEEQRIFTGWMFAESPGLHAVEHPVFDVWLTSCKTNSAPAPSGSAANAPPETPAEAAAEAPTEAPAEAPAAAPDAAAAPLPPPPPPPPAAAEAPPEPLPWAKPPANASSKSR